MPHIVFTAQMSTGIESIDADHRGLVDVINELTDNIESHAHAVRVENTLAALISYAHDHFHREEKLMLQCRYGGLRQHMDDHHQFSLQVYELQRRYVLEPQTVELVEVRDFLGAWLTHHILETDMAYVQAVLKRPSGKAERLRQ